MKKRIGCLLLVVLFCFGLTACDKEVPTPEDTTPTQTDTTTSVTDTTTTAAPTTSATVPSQTDAPTTTTAASSTTTSSATAPSQTAWSAVASPFAEIGITTITLYDPHLFQMEEAVLVRTLTDASEIATVSRRLSAALWEHYPTESHWVKYNPLFAEWALVLTDTAGRQHVLHLLDETVGWASLGTFDAGLTYAEMIAQAKAHTKEGIGDFARYKIDSGTLAYLLSLF